GAIAWRCVDRRRPWPLQLMFADPALSGTCGPVAQLGARMNGIHEVTGSIPVWSTNLPSPAQPTATPVVRRLIRLPRRLRAGRSPLRLPPAEAPRTRDRRGRSVPD